MLLLVDLDNTLVDRASAFDSWAIDFVGALGKPNSEADWLIETDRDGYEPRDSLARAIKERFSLDMPVGDLVDRLLNEHVRSMTIGALTTQALARARKYGWKIAIVTNGTTEQRLNRCSKSRRWGLNRMWMLSSYPKLNESRSRIQRFSGLRLVAWVQSSPVVGWSGTIPLRILLAAKQQVWIRAGFRAARSGLAKRPLPHSSRALLPRSSMLLFIWAH